MRPSFLSRTFFGNLFIACSITCGFSQNPASPPDDWFLKDPETDLVQGVSSEKTYQSLLKDKPSRTVLVAVIDSGIDIDHEDLKGVIWTNEGEIAGNGIDDDKNGYIDDIHGWNFIGGKGGNVDADTYELTREYVRLHAIFGSMDEGKVPKKQKAQYDDYKKIKDKFQKLRDKNINEYQLINRMRINFSESVDTLKALLKVDKLTQASLDTFHATSPSLAFAKGYVLALLRRLEPGEGIDGLMADLNEQSEYYRIIVEYGYNTDFNSRLIVGDNYSNLKERNYGNNEVKGPDSKHGTHVAGIIAADRTNTIGIKGIADNVRIMSVRAVPNGDERDKDIANAIRYAVDNGAKIINMSFGKGFSPEKKVVDEAVAYAEQKGVLLIHAAGNDGQDIDKERDYPTRLYLNGKEASNWLEVGASSAGSDESLAANFSNYGKKSVDLFAPGVSIYSTTPGNTYDHESGTSMASPTAAGVAALVWEYFPDLTARQLADILKKSTRKFDGLKVQKPGGGTADFSDLSNTGGLINAYEAVKLALALKGTPIEK